MQIGAIESRFWSNQKQKTVAVYSTFWSDTARHFEPQPLFPVRAGYTLTATLTLASKRWMVAITDNATGKEARFSISGEAGGPFNQAEWTQENPGRENDHIRYPQVTAPVFQDLTVNSTVPSQTGLYSRWMSVNDINLAPTELHEDSFTLQRASALSAVAAQYLRLFATAGAEFDAFELERQNWTVKTPYQQIATATSRLIRTTQNGNRSLMAARWPKQIGTLVRSSAHITDTLFEEVRPPTVLTAASFTAWNAKLTSTFERGLPAAGKLSLALGLPTGGPSYHR